jgi:putative ABC transport system substrate-binding protein
MRRREFIAGLGGAALVGPLAAQAQQRAMPVIGFLGSSSAGTLRQQLAALRMGLQETGYLEGQNVAIEYRFAEGEFDRLPAMLSDLMRRSIAVLVTNSQGALATKQTTTTIPIVFVAGEDPLKLGLVASLNRPGGNLTGVYMFAGGLEGKRIGLLQEMVPKAAIIAVLINPNWAGAETQLLDVQEAAARLGVQLFVARANAERDFDAAFAAIVQQRAAALLVCASPLFNNRRQQLVVLATRHAIPAIYEFRDFVEAGGLMSYGTNLADAYRQLGIYAGRILKGEKPADLPVVQSAKFEFAINLSTAKALGIDVPGALSARADEVFE